jgi:hypothetical protein
MLNLKEKDNAFTKAQQEAVEQEQIEHTLIGTFNRTKGLKLFAYDVLNDYLYEVDEIFEGDLYLMRNLEGKIRAFEVGHSKTFINPNHRHFEALNLENAERRVQNYKNGDRKALNNLKPPRNKTIKL